MDANQMRIHVNPDGKVEFSVSLSKTLDPSVVANMVAAVRNGIVSPPSSQPTSAPSPMEPPPDQPVEMPVAVQNPVTVQKPVVEPFRVPDRSCQQIPSPVVLAPTRKLSVRQIAAEIDASPEGFTNSFAEFDPVKEFSSSPALVLTADTAYLDMEAPRSTNSGYSVRVPHATQLTHRRLRSENQKLSHHAPYSNFRATGTQTSIDQPRSMDRAFSEAASHSKEPCESDEINALPQRAKPPPRTDNTLPLANPGSAFRYRNRSKPLTAKELDKLPDPTPFQPRDERKRSLSHLTESPVLQAEDDDRHDSPSAPYGAHHDPVLVEDHCPWGDVEYEVTEPYRDPKPAETAATRHQNRSVAWRFFASIGNSWKRKPDQTEDVHQSTLAYATGYAPKFPKRRRPFFARGNTTNAPVTFNFSSPLGVERMLREVAKAARYMGYQVMMRPGENKLRCIKNLGRMEMHVVVMFGTTGFPDGQRSTVIVRRVRGDRNRVDSWRYSMFYRELLERLQRSGIEISQP